MFYQTYEESIQKMVCKDCLYRKYDRYIDGILLEGFRGSACVKFIRKPSEIFEYGCDELYSIAEKNPVDIGTFIKGVNDALEQKNEAPVLEGDTYSVYLGFSTSKIVPPTVHFVSYENIPCELAQNEDYNYLEFASLEEREEFIDSVENAVNENDLNVKGYIHDYANESNLTRFDNNLGLAMKFTLYASFTNGIPVEDYYDLLIKPIEIIGQDYIIDKDVSTDEIVNEIISCSQIRTYSEETKMYIDYNPGYQDYNTCALREKYAFNPLRCQQYMPSSIWASFMAYVELKGTTMIQCTFLSPQKYKA